MSECHWKLDDNPDYSIWETSCSGMFEFNADGPEENDFKFCPYCGGALVQTISAQKESE